MPEVPLQQRRGHARAPRQPGAGPAEQGDALGLGAHHAQLAVDLVAETGDVLGGKLDVVDGEAAILQVPDDLLEAEVHRGGGEANDVHVVAVGDDDGLLGRQRRRGLVVCQVPRQRQTAAELELALKDTLPDPEGP